MEQPFLKRKTNFQGQYDVAKDILIAIRMSNDQLNRMIENKLTNKELRKHKLQFKQQAEGLRDTIQTLEKDAKGVEQRRIAKELKQQYSKEVDRQKNILKTFINQSFETKFTKISILKESRGMRDNSDINNYFVEPTDMPNEKSDGKLFHRINQNLDHDESLKNKIGSPKYSINDDDLAHDIDILEYEKQVTQERQEELDEIEQEAINLNKIVGQLGGIVIEQDQQFMAVQNNQDQVIHNVKGAQDELLQAKAYQSRKKRYILSFAGIVIVVVCLILILVVCKII